MQAVATNLLFDANRPVLADPTRLLFGAVDTALRNLNRFIAGVPLAIIGSRVGPAGKLHRAPAPERLQTVFARGGVTNAGKAGRVPNTKAQPTDVLSAANTTQRRAHNMPVVSNLDMVIRQAPRFIRREAEKHAETLQMTRRNLNTWFQRVAANDVDMSDGKPDHANLVAARRLGFSQFRIA